MLNRTDTYVAAVVLAAVLAGVVLSTLGAPPTDAEIAAALYMSAMGILAHVMLYRLPRGGGRSAPSAHRHTR